MAALSKNRHLATVFDNLNGSFGLDTHIGGGLKLTKGVHKKAASLIKREVAPRSTHANNRPTNQDDIDKILAGRSLMEYAQELRRQGFKGGTLVMKTEDVERYTRLRMASPASVSPTAWDYGIVQFVTEYAQPNQLYRPIRVHWIRDTNNIGTFWPDDLVIIYEAPTVEDLMDIWTEELEYRKKRK